MIKCKEDLFNRYIENVPGELRDLLFDKCNEFGIGINIGSVKPDYLEVYSCDFGESDPYELVGCGCLEVDSTPITLSDFKPTQTEYVQVTESIFDLRDKLEGGELYERYVESIKSTSLGEGSGIAYGYSQIKSELDLFKLEVNGDAIYRKVEKVVDWRDEVYEWQHTRKIGIYTPLELSVNSLVESHPDEFLELCRVALRANGEID